MNLRFRQMVSAFFALTLLLAVGCAIADETPAPKPTVRGGVLYEPTRPLNAVVTPKWDEKSPPTQAYTYAVTYRGGGDEIVPALLCVPVEVAQSKTKAPCVLVLHGITQRKEETALVSAALNRKGYVTLAIDIAGHGERLKAGMKPPAEWDLPEMRRMLGQTIIDLRRGVDFLTLRPEVDTSRLGFLGLSLGGIIGGVFAGDEPRLKGAVLWSAGGDWGKLLMTSEHRLAKRFREQTDITQEKIEEALRDVDPVASLRASASSRCRWLFVNGEKDTIVPNPCIDELFAAIKEPKKRLVLPGGHVPEMSIALGALTQMIAWMDANVKEEPTASPAAN